MLYSNQIDFRDGGLGTEVTQALDNKEPDYFGSFNGFRRCQT